MQTTTLKFLVLGLLVGCGSSHGPASPDAAGIGGDSAVDDAGTDSPVVPRGLNDRCTGAEPVLLVEGRLELTGETESATDEFSTLDCDSRGTAATLRGAQRYYSLRAEAGFRYSFTLTPSFHSVFYGFDQSVGCTEQEIQNACRSSGDIGFASPLINPRTGLPGAIVFGEPPDFVPSEDMELILVVDSDGGAGTFTLTIEATPCATDPSSCVGDP